MPRPRNTSRRRFLGSTFAIMVLLTVSADTPAACPLPACTITFDGTCPNSAALCGAEFVGGTGCVIDFLAFCYSTGTRAYRVNAGTSIEITLDGDLVDLNVFFAHSTGGSGTMHFFNEAEEEIGTPLVSNGPCNSAMPPPQAQTFSEPVRRIEVTATGVAGSRVYIDTFSVNPTFSPPAADLDGDCTVGASDLAQLLGSWGSCVGCAADLNGDLVVDAADLAELLGNWS